MRRPSSPGSNDEDLKRRLSLSAVRRVLMLAMPYRGVLTLSALIMLAGNAVQFSLAPIARAAVDTVTKTHSVRQLDTFTAFGLGMIALASVLGYLRIVISAYAGNKIVRELRERLFSHLQRMPVVYFDRVRSGDIASHLSNDVSQLQITLTDDVSGFVGNVALLAGGMVYTLSLLWQLTAIAVSILVLMMAFFVFMGRNLRKVNRAALDALADATGTITEAISNIRLVKAFVREPYEDSRVSEKLGILFHRSMRSSRLEGVMVTVGMAGAFLMFIGCGWYGYRGVLSGAFTAGQVAGFVVAIFMILPPMTQLAALFTRLQRAIGASERLFAILDDPLETPDPPSAVMFPKGPGEVIYERVVFDYVPENPVIDGLSLRVLPGKVTALVGPSGSGKTTLASLLYRFYEPQSGEILIDGEPIKNITRSSLRENIGIVPQDPILFNGSIKDNIRYGRLDATEAEIEQAARDANVHEFVSGFANGYETQIGERGITLSGGQRQRVSIARALLKDPKILVLDEATSSLDNRSESLIREALDRLMQNRTTLVIAHRLSTVKNADQIAVVSHGKVVETGTHDQLIRSGGLYADLYELVDA